jgi:L-lactate dehydrogenase complex protein LldE
MKVSLFVTCLTDTFYPRVGEAVVRVLEHLGHTVEFPESQTCCGQPMWNTGCHADAAVAAKRMVEAFDGAEIVVTPSGSCAAMVREYYMDLLGKDPQWAARTQAFVDKVYEFTEFLTKKHPVDLKALGCRWPAAPASIKTTYHYSCHLRGLHMTDEASRLLKQIDGIEFVPINKEAQCCGFGGTFAVKFPEVSGSLVNDKTACVAATGAQVLVCNDGGCAMNITGALHRQKSPVVTKHLAEIIAEGLGLMPIVGPAQSSRQPA